MSKKMSFIPNTFQTPNAIIDLLMPYLTDSEFRVLMYAIRHILGWQHKAEKMQAAISLSNFQNGFSYHDNDGNEHSYNGTNLSRSTIITALEGLGQYRILEKVGNATNSGQVWKLRFMIKDDVDTDGLEKRLSSKNNSNTKRTAKARKSKQSVAQTTDKQSVAQTEVVSRTDRSGKSDRHNETHGKDNSKDHNLSQSDIEQKILDAFKEYPIGYKLNTSELSMDLGFKDDDVFDPLPFKSEYKPYRDALSELWNNKTLTFKDMIIVNPDNTQTSIRFYWLAENGESKAIGIEWKTAKDAIETHWLINGDRSGNLAHMLLGTATDKRYKTYNLKITATLAEIIEFPKWWSKHYEGVELPRSPEIVQDRFLQMRNEQSQNITSTNYDIFDLGAREYTG